MRKKVVFFIVEEYVIFDVLYFRYFIDVVVNFRYILYLGFSDILGISLVVFGREFDVIILCSVICFWEECFVENILFLVK